MNSSIGVVRLRTNLGLSFELVTFALIPFPQGHRCFVDSLLVAKARPLENEERYPGVDLCAWFANRGVLYQATFHVRGPQLCRERLGIGAGVRKGTVLPNFRDINEAKRIKELTSQHLELTPAQHEFILHLCDSFR
jgi:hypothetical protein